MKCEITIDDEPIVVGSKCAHVVHIGDNELGLISSEAYKELRSSINLESEELPEVKEGMRVRTLTGVDSRSGVRVFAKGTICIVGRNNHDEDDPYQYRLDYAGDWFWYSRDMFEVIPDTEICVGDVVKTTAGSVAVVTHVDENMGTAALMFPTGYLNDYDSDLLTYTGKHCFGIDEILNIINLACQICGEED